MSGIVLFGFGVPYLSLNLVDNSLSVALFSLKFLAAWFPPGNASSRSLAVSRSVKSLSNLRSNSSRSPLYSGGNLAK